MCKRKDKAQIWGHAGASVRKERNTASQPESHKHTGIICAYHNCYLRPLRWRGRQNGRWSSPLNSFTGSTPHCPQLPLWITRVSHGLSWTLSPDSVFRLKWFNLWKSWLCDLNWNHGTTCFIQGWGHNAWLAHHVAQSLVIVYVTVRPTPCSLIGYYSFFRPIAHEPRSWRYF